MNTTLSRYRKVTLLLLLAVVSGQATGCRRRNSSGLEDMRTSNGDGMTFERKMDAARKILDMNQAYVAARNLYLSKDGLLDLGKAMAEQTHNWTGEWKVALKFIDSASALPIDQVHKQLATQFEKQMGALTDISRLSDEVEYAGVMIKAKLASAPTITYAVTGYEQGYEAEVAALKSLSNSVDAFVSNAKAHRDNLREQGGTITKLLNHRLVGAFTAAKINDLQRAIDMINELLLAEATLQPIERHIQREYLRLSALSTAGRAFRLGDETPRFLAACASAAAAVDATVVGADYRDASKRRMNSLCLDMQATAVDIQADHVGDLVAEATARRIAKAKIACESKAPTKIQCATYAWIAALTQSDIAALPTIQLHALENALDQMEAIAPVKP
jgi:hypothetical protein